MMMTDIAFGGNTCSFSGWVCPDSLGGDRCHFGRCWSGQSIYMRTWAGSPANNHRRGKWNYNEYFGGNYSALVQQAHIIGKLPE
jgi:hypothetical protein